MIYRVMAYPRLTEAYTTPVAKADTSSVSLARATLRLWRREGFEAQIYNVEEERVQ